jgi:hypothetical protein
MHQAPGQHLGYSLQITRVLARLLEAKPGDIVSLEGFEDVGVESSEETRIAEQVKSTLDGNPVSDHATDLWKAFNNWICGVESNLFLLDKTQFVIYVSQPKSGDIVESFSKSKSSQEALDALLTARSKLWGQAPGFNRRCTVSDSINKYVDRVFSTDPKIMSSIIKSFTLVCGSGSPLEDLKLLMESKPIPKEIIEATLVHLLGWVKKRTDMMLEQIKPARIQFDDFNQELMSFIRKYDRRTILATFAKDPSKEEIEVELKLRKYVRQLEIIDCKDDEKIRAVRDYLRSANDRTYWSEQCIVQETSFNEFEDNLIRTWGNLKKKTSIVYSDKDEITKGQCLYTDCQLYTGKLEGIEVPDHFTPGSFHKLSDEEVIGWHFDYKSQLKKKTGD